MDDKHFFFAGGGTGGHIYPAVAVEEQIAKLLPEAKIHFFCSRRTIDEQILAQTDFEFTRLTATGFSARPDKLISFCSSFFASYKKAKEAIEKFQEDSDTSHLIVPSRLKDSSDDRVDILKWVLGLSNSEDITS